MFSFASTVSAMERDIGQMGKQSQFALASALTQQARAIADGLPGQMASQLDRPTAFTQRGVFTVSARKGELRAVVGIKDAQAAYLHWQVEGGVRAPARRALKLPGAIELDAHGNISRAAINRLMASARNGRWLTPAAAKKFGVPQASGIFYGVPKGHTDMPAGIYSRRNKLGQRSLVPLIIFERKSAAYQPRFNFWGYCHGRASELGGRLIDGMDRAMATAR